jgi:DNA processing protein
MKEQDLFYLLALQRIEGVGDIMAKNCTHCGSAEAVLLQSFSASGYRRNW